MKKIAAPFFLLLLLCACNKEENLTGNWNVKEHTAHFPFPVGVAFNADKTFEGRTDSSSVTGVWEYSSHHNGDYVTVGTDSADTLIFKIERLALKKLELSIYGYSFTHDYATLKK